MQWLGVCVRCENVVSAGRVASRLMPMAGARGAEQRNSAPLLFLCESELGLQEAKKLGMLKLAAHDRRTRYRR